MSQRRGLTGLAFPAGGGLGWASPPGPLSTCGEGESAARHSRRLACHSRESGNPGPLVTSLMPSPSRFGAHMSHAGVTLRLDRLR